jgi:Aspartyl protease
MIRYNYNRQVSPPAPFIHVTIKRGDGTGSSVAVPAQLDTAADKTVIPMSAVRDLGLEQAGLLQVAGLGNAAMPVPVYVVEMVLHEMTPVTVDVLSVAGEEHVLLGRDVLNRYRVTFDGPKLLCTIE